MSAKGNATGAREFAYAMLPLMGKLWTREEKLDVLAGYDDAGVGTRELFLTLQNLTAATLDLWRSESEAGELTDDQDEENGPVRVDRSILDLVELFRGVIAGAQRADVRPANNTDSWDVLFGEHGNWRANYLARARSALLLILAAVKDDPTELKLRGHDASEAIAQVRAYWGVDEIPLDPGDVGKERTARLRRNRRWSEQICCSRVAAVALRDWLRSTNEAWDEPLTIACDVPPVWPGPAEEWPPSEERRFLVHQVVRRLSSATARTEAQAMAVNDARALEILRRRAVELHDRYLRRGKGQADGFWYLQQEITRPWQSGISMIDLRTPAERADPGRAMSSGRRRWAAISAMCMYSVVAEWDERAIERIRLKMWALAQELPGEEPEHKFRKRALANRQALRAYPKIVEARTPEPPAFVARTSSQVQDLFAAAQLLRLAKGATYLKIYLKKRTQIELSALSEASLRVVQLSDYSVNLDIASRGVRRNIPADLLRAARTCLIQAAQRGGSVYSAIAYRNDALGLQRVDFSGAIATGTRGIAELARADDRGTADAEREALEIDEQLSLSLAGCHVQWLEHLLSGTDRWVRSVEPEQWVEHCRRALYWIERAVEGIERMYDRGQLKGPRYAVGHLSDESWLFRAWEIYYRCVCAIATAQLAFGIATPVLAPDLLERIARRVTRLPAAIPETQLPRLLHSMLWHSFLSQNVIPALQPDTVNASLVRVDPITKVLRPNEVGDDNATITMTDDRVKLLTDFLINMGWSAGAIGEFTPGSAVWFALDHASGGAYGRWREEFDGLLHEDLQSD